MNKMSYKQHIHKNYSAIRKGNSFICENMDEAGGPYSKWNKPDTKDKYYMISFMWNLKKKKSTHRNREYSSGCLGLWGRKNGELMVKVYKFL